MTRSLPISVRLAAVWLLVVGLIVACGSGEESTFEPPAVDADGGGGGGGSSGGFQPGAPEGGTAVDLNCKKLTCADQKIECGPAGDGCGGLIADCGKCGAGLRCGGPNALSKCVSPSIGTGCTPKTCAQLSVQCGLAGDGCGGTLTCGSCQPGEQCGVTGKPSQCVVATAASADGGACVQKTCADYLVENKNCGPQSNGCGGTIDCGACVDPEFCGGGGPSKCAVSGGGACAPKTCADYVGKCGPQPNGCGGVTTDCGGCVLPAVCGGGGTPSVCGGGFLPGPGGGGCIPKAACGANECGQVADGCGGVFDCGTANCTAGKICGGAGVPNVCGTPNCVKLMACPAGLNCGTISDNCGGIVNCGGACPAPSICGGGGVANRCGGGTVTGPGGGACVPLTMAVACPANSCGPVADGCGGVVTCGNCVSPALCGAGSPAVANRCGGGNQCTPQTRAAACGTMTCGYAPDGCGGSYTCGTNAGACPTGQSCGIFNPNECASLSGPCINNTTTACTSNTMCCSGLCGALGKCIPLTADGGVPSCSNLGVACTGGNTCCSGVCSGGLCATNNTNACLAAGTSCATNAQCCSLGCIGGKCSLDTSWCRQINEACTTNSQCCNGACTGATATAAGRCTATTGSGGGLGCSVAGTVKLDCTSKTTQVCHSDCCSGACGPHDSTTGFSICQQPSGCAPLGELCQGTGDCCQGLPYPIAGGSWPGSPLTCNGIVNGGPSNSFGRCNGGGGCSKPGEMCKTATDACSFSNSCCEPPDIALAGGGNCQNNNGACCKHDNLGIPRCVGNAVCRPASATCNTSADCCPDPITNIPPPCTDHDNNAATPKTCAAQQCIANDGFCTADGDCCNGNCYRQAPGDTTGQCKIPTCTKKTCADYPGKCGALSDGCGDIALAADGVTKNCGGCTAPQTCGGAGTPNVCGGTICTAATCASLLASAGIECGTVPDGCGGTNLTCGPCPAGTTCGGGGVAYKCGAPTCNALTCAGQNIECGQTGDGCGNVLTCATCPDGKTCGGGGIANKCGSPACVPITVCPAGKNCGDIPNGCGGSVHCGDCPAGQACGGGGAANVCGAASCAAKTCAQLGAQCGGISDTCGGVLACGPCGPDQFCNGQNLCVGLNCTPKTCAQLGVQCGPTANTCGGLVDCGGCPVGQGCGAGGVPGKCGTQPCAPKTCAELGAVCGQVANGCGSLTPDCGTCAGSLSCKNGACVQACTPRTCAAAGANCGPISDGCGGIVDCGPCANGETCGFNGQANICGKEQPK